MTLATSALAISASAGRLVDYTYDALNRLATVKDNNLAALNGGITTYSYDTVGNLKSYLYPNGVTTTYNYNNLNRLTTMTIATPLSTLSGYSHTLGAAGNRTAVTELSGRKVNYTYDDLYRLTSESIAADPHGINGNVSYSYDPVGNRLNRSSSVPPVPSQSSTYDANDRSTSDSYDSNGNTLTASDNTYAYDFENHLTSLNAGNVTYVYNGDGNRVAKTVGGVTTKYLVDTNNHSGYAQVFEELQAGAVVKQFTYGHDLISQRMVGSNLSFYGYDGHGSVRFLADATATVTDTYNYDAFGNLIYRSGTTSNDYLYSGEQFDANLGFYYLRARYMNPSSGRFWTLDEYEGNNPDPASLHKYLYSADDPVNRIDPSGRISIGETIAVLGVAVTIAAISTLLYMRYYKQLPARFVSFEWKNQWNFDKGHLSATEIEDVKAGAIAEMKRAYAGFGLIITNGGGTNRIIVDGYSDAAVGETRRFASSSVVYYDSIEILARRYAQEKHITERPLIVHGIGKAIGAVAAHELGHQGLITWVNDNSTDPNTYDYHSGNREQLYFGNLHWSPAAVDKMRDALPH